MLQNLFAILVKFPVLSIVSLRFYYDVMFKMRGIGLSYLFAISFLISAPASLVIESNLQSLQKLDLPYVVQNIPASYIDEKGIMHASSGNDKEVFVIKNRQDVPIIEYNLHNKEVAGYTGTFPIVFNGNSLRINTVKGEISLPWSHFADGTQVNVNQSKIANLIDSTLSMSMLDLWPIVCLWVFAVLIGVMLIAGSLGKVLALVGFKVKIPYSSSLRLASFASTSVAVLMLAQFYIEIPLSFFGLCAIPLIYFALFIHNVCRVLSRSMKDPDYALSQENPLQKWFELQSRFKDDGSYDVSGKGQNETLSETKKQEFNQNLKQRLSSPDYWENIREMNRKFQAGEVKEVKEDQAVEIKTTQLREEIKDNSDNFNNNNNNDNNDNNKELAKQGNKQEANLSKLEDTKEDNNAQLNHGLDSRLSIKEQEALAKPETQIQNKQKTKARANITESSDKNNIEENRGLKSDPFYSQEGMPDFDESQSPYHFNSDEDADSPIFKENDKQNKSLKTTKIISAQEKALEDSVKSKHGQSSTFMP